MQGCERARGASVTSTSVGLSLILVMYQAGVLRATLESVYRDYDGCCVVSSGANEASGKAGADEVSLEE